MPDDAALLVGWRRTPARSGIVLSLQLVRSVADFREHRFERLAIALNDRQLRSLARDLQRAAAARGLDLFAQPTGWRRLLRWITPRR
jgi:hypothetical protein